MERTSSEKQSATLAQQQRDASNAKHLQNQHHQQQSSKNPPSRKSRESRSRSQDWPDVPDIGKIQENNPEILAQKILETGRQIEAGRIPSKPNVNPVVNNNSNNNNPTMTMPMTTTSTRTRLPQATLSFSSPSTQVQSQMSCKESTSRIQEPPRVANFEDRLKSIITSVLNEDQQNRNKQQQIQMQQMQQNEPDRKRMALPANVTAPDYTQVCLS